MNEAILQDNNCWLYFTQPHRIIQTNIHAEVFPTLQEIERLVEKDHCYAVGFITYDAAPGFDWALPVRLENNCAFQVPLLYFALYSAPIILPHLPSPNCSSHGRETTAFPRKWSPSISPEIYYRALVTIRDHIERGDTYQVNYTWRLRSQFTGAPRVWFHDMVAAQEPRYAAYLDLGNFVILSVSPELFFARDGVQLITRPMKGTIARAPDVITDKIQAERLFTSNKDRAENIMIVDMMRNDLSRIAQLGSVKVANLFSIEKYPNVWHMTSTIHAQTDAPLAEIFRALFPAASVTGAPKVKTMEIISRLESDPRGIYTGAIGFIAPERRAEFNVAIRTIILNCATGAAQYGVGGGIVWDSNSAAEYAECLSKARVLWTPRPNFELFETFLWTPTAGFFLLAEHLQRLIESANYFSYPIEQKSLVQTLHDLSRQFPFHPQRVRLFITQTGAIRTDFSPYQKISGKITLGLARSPIDISDPFFYHKTTHRRHYEQARQELPNAMDVILWNEREEITETTIANIVVELDGELITPPQSSGLLAGTYRRKLLSAQIIREKTITLAELKRAPRLWIINSLRKWQAARLV